MIVSYRQLSPETYCDFINSYKSQYRIASYYNKNHDMFNTRILLLKIHKTYKRHDQQFSLRLKMVYFVYQEFVLIVYIFFFFRPSRNMANSTDFHVCYGTGTIAALLQTTSVVLQNTNCGRFLFVAIKSFQSKFQIHVRRGFYLLSRTLCFKGWNQA